MSNGAALTWRRLPEPIRTLGRWITIVQLVGYTVSLYYVWVTSRLSPTGAAEHYRGGNLDVAEGAMQFPKSLAEMLTITHTHLLSMAAIFVFSGIGLALCAAPSERWRRFLIAEPFVALLVSFSAMWLMRYTHPDFSWLLGASSLAMAVTFYVQSFLILRELARPGGLIS